uniref:Uncharacterized protein n=1 Tax=Ignavibacterium album TaxID=591197 RepID=A0A832LK16_9BACT
MRLILRFIAILLFSFASIFAQNESNQFAQLKIRIKSNDTYAYNHFTVIQQDNISSQHYSFLNLTGQALVGSTLAIVFSIPPISAGFADAWSGKSNDASQTALEILAISSYLFGAAVGVHWIASYENPNLSFWGTFGYSTIGGSVGAVLVSILATNYTTIPTVGVIIVALTHIIGAMIYASFISDWPNESQEISFHKINISHKDLIEQTKIINLELLRIKL